MWTTARTGPWLARSPGLIQTGAIGVLLDHALGETLFVHRAPGQWSLTTELAYDVLVPPPWTTVDLHVESVIERRDGSGGFARGTLVDDDGRPLVMATTWARYVAGDDGVGSPAPDGAPRPMPVAGSLQELLGYRVQDVPDGLAVALPDAGSWTNDYGVLHGGIWAVLAELAATETFARGRSELVTSHVHVSYLRRAVPGTVSAVARRRHQGRSFGEVEVDGIDADGRPCVTATVTGRSRD
ncbi:hypothetical protein GCM10023175_28990 [Pseudonocardia xishanensis]|uniref:Thioesterase domain-containing protein n=1 Tax=Pseudonocardia xishanensis TaxID=630995 RepID=A0ABP8RRQ8_9PSEU